MHKITHYPNITLIRKYERQVKLASGSQFDSLVSIGALVLTVVITSLEKLGKNKFNNRATKPRRRKNNINPSSTSYYGVRK